MINDEILAINLLLKTNNIRTLIKPYFKSNYSI